MLRIAIVGCGKIADSHASQIQRIKDCEIVGVCDREELMAKQLYERFRVGEYFNDPDELINRARPDVVHITTPPQTHFTLTRRFLEQGCHVYVEKPFTLNTAEARELIELAEQTGLKLTVGHDDQFRHVARRMRALIADGYLGGPPVHMESYYCYEMGDNSSYANAFLGDKQHWIRKLPGQLLHNVISHGIARIAEYLTRDEPRVMAYGFVSPTLQKIDEHEIIDELRVIVAEENGMTAYFTFSAQMRPSLHQFRIYGPKNGLLLDQDNETLIRLRGARYKSYLEHFVPPFSFAKQYLANWASNARRFLANDFHMKSGMKYLFESFYRSIIEKSVVPIPYRQILLTSWIMDRIFEELGQIPQADAVGFTAPHLEAPSIR